jgi:ABC-type dipeptide/oligopeptide/nickel transport system permease subunit
MTDGGPRPQAGKTYAQIVAGEFLKNRLSVAASAVIAALFAIAVLAPFLANGRPYRIVIAGTVHHPIRGPLHFDPAGEAAYPLFAALTRNEILVLLAAVCFVSALAAVRVVAAGRPVDEIGGMRRAIWAGAAGVFLAGAAAVGAFHQDINDPPGWYRELLERGQARNAIFAPVPFDYKATDPARSYRPPIPEARYAVIREVRRSLARGGLPEPVITRLGPIQDERFADADALRARLAEVLTPEQLAAHGETIVEASDTAGHLLGTDKSGGDVLARLIYGSRTSLAVGFVAVGISVLIGVIVGSLMGYLGGFADIALMRIMEIVMSIPTLILIITIVAFFPRNLFTIMAVIGVTTWPTVARFVRAEFLRLRKQDFVSAARALGASDAKIMFRHMLPNGIAPVLVDATFGVGAAIFVEATLSFLGLGPGPDNPSWGAMLSESFSDSGLFLWWMSMLPGAAIFVTVLCYNLVGEGLRDAIDPRLRKSAS